MIKCRRGGFREVLDQMERKGWISGKMSYISGEGAVTWVKELNQLEVLNHVLKRLFLREKGRIW